jgi:phospholipid transport system substrate-binding protein
VESRVNRPGLSRPQLNRPRLNRPKLAAAIGIAVLLSLTSAKPALCAPDEPPATGAETTDSSPSKVQHDAPMKVVDALHASLIDVMKHSKTLGYDGRFAQLDPVINTLFDIPFMAEKSVGRYWKTLNEQDQGRLLATFARFTVANYAGRFNDFSGQSFETFKQEPSKQGTVLVYSRLDTGKGEIVQLNYRLRPDNDKGWKIIDVLLNGTVSELALRRSEYCSLIQREGFAALMTALDERIANLASGKVPEKAS